MGYRVYHVQKPKNRHLVDLRPVKEFPPTQRVNNVLVITPAELICEKVLSMVGRRKKRKGTMDLADLQILLLTFPDLKQREGAVAERLRAVAASKDAMDAWRDLVASKIEPEDEDEGF